jgi:hypothetical protein
VGSAEGVRKVAAKRLGLSLEQYNARIGSVLGRQIGAGPKGGDWEAWPEDLRVRQFPRAVAAVTP